MMMKRPALCSMMLRWEDDDVGTFEEDERAREGRDMTVLTTYPTQDAYRHNNYNSGRVWLLFLQ